MDAMLGLLDCRSERDCALATEGNIRL